MMSTASEHLEATVWIDSTYPDIPAQQRGEFFTAVDAYYRDHPVADRCPDTIGILHEDDRAFTDILEAIVSDLYATSAGSPTDRH